MARIGERGMPPGISGEQPAQKWRGQGKRGREGERERGREGERERERERERGFDCDAGCAKWQAGWSLSEAAVVNWQAGCSLREDAGIVNWQARAVRLWWILP